MLFSTVGVGDFPLDKLFRKTRLNPLRPNLIVVLSLLNFPLVLVDGSWERGFPFAAVAVCVERATQSWD